MSRVFENEADERPDQSVRVVEMDSAGSGYSSSMGSLWRMAL